MGYNSPLRSVNYCDKQIGRPLATKTKIYDDIQNRTDMHHCAWLS